MDRQRLRFGSLFAGIGGFDLGLERAGMQCAWQCEIAKRPNEILGYHWPNVRRFPDVTKPPTGLASVDLLCGGFPCQDVSVAGNRSGLAGKKSRLFWSFVDLARELSPEWVLLENVPGLLNSNGTRDLGTVLGALGKLGYLGAFRVLNARYFGVAQNRRRVFILGRRGAGGVHPGEVLFEPEAGLRNPPPARNERKEQRQIIGTLKFSSGKKMLADLDEASAGQIRVTKEGRVRILLPVEAERLQGLPDGWTAMGTNGPIADSPRYCALGNAVSVPVAEWIGRRIMEA